MTPEQNQKELIKAIRDTGQIIANRIPSWRITYIVIFTYVTMASSCSTWKATEESAKTLKQIEMRLKTLEHNTK